MSQNDEKACLLVSNPDISGTGVRVAFYIQALLTGILAYTPKTDVDAPYWSMTITAFALFISALALLKMHQLSFYQGILVTDLLYLHSYVAIMCLLPLYKDSQLAYNINTATHQRRARDWWRGNLRALPVLSFATVFGLIVWTRAPTFGSQPECNDKVTFVLIGFPLDATRSGRTVALVFVWVHVYIIAVSIIGGITLSLRSALTPDRPGGRSAIRIPWAPARTLWEELTDASEHRRSLGPRAHKHLSDFENGPDKSRHISTKIWIWVVIVTITIFVGVFIVMVERTIAENAWLTPGDDSDSAWTLGQIFPVIMLAVPLTSFIKFFVRRKKSRRKAKGLAKIDRNPLVGMEIANWHTHLSSKVV